MLAEPTDVLFRQRGGSIHGGLVSLAVDQRVLGEAGGDRPGEAVYRLSLQRGQHRIQWRVRGGDLGNCQLLVIDGEGRPLPIIHTLEMAAAVRMGRPLPTLNMPR